MDGPTSVRFNSAPALIYDYSITAAVSGYVNSEDWMGVGRQS